jgi:hypothetical protein
VVDLGAMKRSDVPGEAFRHLHEIPPEETTNEERKHHLLIQPAAPSDLKSPPETITAPSDLKCPPETITAPSDLKCPPETITSPSDLKSPPETIKEDKDSQELEEDFVEYHNEREDSNEEEEDLVESHIEREDINEESKRATNQESLFTFAPSIPPFPKWTVWMCVKCDTEQSEEKRRRGTCKSWKGGKRWSMKMSKPTKKDNETHKISAAGRKKRIHLLQQHCLMLLPVPVCHLRVMTCSVH